MLVECEQLEFHTEIDIAHLNASWVGDPRGGYKYPMKNITINGTKYEQVFGASIPGPIWKVSMKGAQWR